jgi:hypothetical protein
MASFCLLIPGNLFCCSIQDADHLQNDNGITEQKLFASKDIGFGKYRKCSQMSLITNSSHLLLTYFMRLAIKNADIIPKYMDKNA